MCTNPDSPWDGANSLNNYTREKIIERLKALKLTVGEPLLLTGGEPTIHSSFLEILHFARRIFPENELRVLTNGRRFAYLDFARQTLEISHLSIAVSLCGPTAEVHDRITGTKGSFGQTINGIKNLLALKRKGQSIEIRTVLTKLSYRHLPAVLALIGNWFLRVDRVVVIFMETEGQAEKNWKQIGLRYHQFKPYFSRLSPYLETFKEMRFYHFPLCAIDIEFWPYVWRTLPQEETTFVSSCKSCCYRPHCLGIHRGYLKAAGCREFKPIKQEGAVLEVRDDFFHPIVRVNEQVNI